MTMLAETVDAVIGIDTHRDTHEAEIADPAGKPIATMRIGNDSAAFARLLAAIAKTVPGPRVAVCVEGTRSYSTVLARSESAPENVVPISRNPWDEGVPECLVCGNVHTNDVCGSEDCTCEALKLP